MLEELPFDLVDCVAHRVKTEGSTDKPATKFDLKRELIPVSRHDHVLYLRVPEDALTDGMGALSYINGESYGISLWRKGGIYLSEVEFGKLFGGREELITRYKNGLRAKAGLRNGSIRITGDRIDIELGIRRYSDLTDNDVAEGVYYYGFPRDDGGWTARYMTPKFYRDLVHPYVKDNKEKNPFEWALNRTEVAAGFVQAIGIGRDCPVQFTEYAYRKMAPLVCNQMPPALKAPRSFNLDAKNRPLFEAAQNAWGKAFSPELACFVLDNADYLDVAMICDAEIIGLVKQIPRCLHNGLIIYRLTDFFRGNMAMRSDAKSALIFSLEVVVDIYGGDEEPWWFKEDIDLRQIFDGNIGDLEDYLELVKKLAKASGFAFCYTLQVYKKVGGKLAQQQGIGEDEAIAFCTKITQGYGIGNTERACNVINFAIEIISGVGSAEQKTVLGLFEEHAKRHTPITEIIGRLEGEEAGVELPGMISLVRAGLGVKRLRREKLDELTIGATHVKELTEHLARPLIERARTLPTVTVEVGRHRLLAANIEKRLALPVAAERVRSEAVTNPLIATFEFYQQLREECGDDNDSLAEIYFLMFASKMPNPFKPPRGFLKFLAKYKSIYLPEYAQEIFVDPRNTEEHAEARKQSAKEIVNKYLIISNLLDAWIIGILNDNDLFGILNWMLEEAPDDLKMEVEKAVRAQHAKRAEQAEREPEEGYVPDPEREERDIQCDTRMYVRDREMYVWKRRIKAIAEGVDILLTMNVFIALGILEKSDVDAILADRLNFFQTTDVGYGDAVVRNFENLFHDDEKVSFTTAFFLDKDGISRYAKHLRTMGKLEILDTDKLIIGLRSGDGNLTRSCLRDLLLAVRNFEESVKQITELDEKIKEAQEADEARLWKVSDPMIDSAELVKSLRQLWQAVFPFINPNVINILLGTYMKASKFAYFSAAIAGNTDRIRQQIFGRGGRDTMECEVKATSVASLGLVSTVLALGDMDTRSLAGITRASLPKGRGATNGGVRLSTALAIPPQRIMLEVSGRLQKVYNTAREWIIEVRKETMGLLPVGGKIHVLHPVDEKRFDAFVRLLGFSQTSFRLIHANTSVNLPPAASAAELRARVRALEAFGIIDREYPELQICLPGRLDLHRAAILGSAILLATEDAVEYDKNSFMTSHDEYVGKRIMLYDAGGTRVILPFMSPLDGRTDMQGLNSSGKDIEWYQLLGTTLIQDQVEQGPFAKLASEFEKCYRIILQRHGIEWVLNKTWIFDPHDKSLNSDAAAMDHLKTVQGCTNAYFSCAAQRKRTGVNEGIIFEVRALLDWLKNEIGKIQDEVYNSGEPCKEMRILLDL